MSEQSARAVLAIASSRGIAGRAIESAIQHAVVRTFPRIATVACRAFIASHRVALAAPEREVGRVKEKGGRSGPNAPEPPFGG